MNRFNGVRRTIGMGVRRITEILRSGLPKNDRTIFLKHIDFV